MPKQVEEKYKEFYFETQESTTTEFSAESKGELDLGRFLDGLPTCWKVTGFQRSFSLKTLILSNPLLIYEDHLELYEKILTFGFRVFVWSDSKFVECKKVGEIISAVAKVIPTTEQVVNEAFLEFAKCSADQFIQLNYLDFERMKNNLRALVGIEPEFEHHNELCINFKKLFDLPDKILKPLLSSIKDKKIKSLEINEIYEIKDNEKAHDLFHFIIENFQDIRSISFNDDGILLFLLFFDKNPVIFPLLEKIEIENQGYEFDVENFNTFFNKVITKRALKSINTSFYTMLSDEQIEFIQTINTLEDFNFQCDFESNKDLFQKKHHQWKCLEIDNVKHEEKSSYLFDPSCFPVMEHLKINAESAYLRFHSISHNEHKVYPLRTLSLSCMQLGFAEFLNILKYYPGLTRLKLFDVTFHDLPDVIQIPVMKKLSSLEIRPENATRAALIAGLLNSAPALEELELNNAKIINEGFSPDLYSNKNNRLRTLKIDSVNLRQSFFIFLLKKFCNLESLIVGKNIKFEEIENEKDLTDIKLSMLRTFKMAKNHALFLELIENILSSTSTLVHFHFDEEEIEQSDVINAVLERQKKFRNLTWNDASLCDLTIPGLEKLSTDCQESRQNWQKFLQRSSNLKYLTLGSPFMNEDEKEDNLSEIKDDFFASSLLHLSVKGMSGYPEHDDYSDIISGAINLVSLELNDIYLYSLISENINPIFNQLKKLKIRSTHTVSLFEFFLKTNFSLLVSLDVDSPDLSEKSIESILKKCPRLVHIIVSTARKISNIYLQDLQERYPFLYITCNNSYYENLPEEKTLSFLTNEKDTEAAYTYSSAQELKSIDLHRKEKKATLSLCTEEQKTEQIFTHLFLENIPAGRTICAVTKFNIHTFNYEPFEFDEKFSAEIICEFSKKKIDELKKYFQNRDDIVFSYPINKTLDSNQYFVLPVSNLSDQIALDENGHLCLSSNYPIRVYFYSGCYVVRLKEQSGPVKLVIRYLLYTGGYHKLSYHNVPILNHVFNKHALEDKSVMHYPIAMDLTDDSPFGIQFKLNSKGVVTIDSGAFTLNQLIHYLSLFKPGKLSQPDAKGLDFLNGLLRDQVGSCEHRAVIFDAIMQVLGLENVCRLYQVITSTGKAIHLGVSVYDESLKHWINIELGGYKMDLVAKVPPSLPSSNSYELKTIDRTSIFRPTIQFEDAGLNGFDNLLQEAKKISPKSRNILIKNCNKEKAFQIYAGLLPRSRCYFINELKDVSKKITVIKDDGELAKIDSPLVRFLKNAKSGDVLLVAFDEKHPQFNSLIDSQGRQLDKETAVPEGVIVIGLISKEAGPFFREDFLSRFSAQCDIDKLLASPVAMPYELLSGDVPKDSINLTGESDPLSILKKTISVDEKNCFRAEKGLFIQLCDQSKEEKKATTIALINPELNDNTKMFLIQACIGNEVEFNGDVLPFPAHVSIKCFQQDYCFSLPVESSLEKLNKQSWQFALNPITYDAFFKFQHFSQAGFRRLPGLLEQSKNKECTVLMTESIPFDKWDKFLKEARSHQVKLRLIIAPNVDFPSEMKCIEPGELSLEESKRAVSNRISVVVASDTDKAVDEIFSKMKKPCRVLNVHENLGFNSIFFEIKAEASKKSFEFIPGTVLNELLDGHTVFLKGDLSIDLASQLETLFSKEPILLINGKQVKIDKGKLIIVTSNEKIFSFAQPEQGWPIYKISEQKQISEAKPAPITEYKNHARDLDAALKTSPIVRIRGDVGLLRNWVNSKNLEDILKKKVNVYCGADNCEAWMAGPKETINVLIIDDSDTKRFDNLYDVCNRWSGQSILLRSQICPLPKNCVVISLESLKNEHNDLISIQAATLFFEKESIQELAQRLIEPVLRQYPEMDEKMRHEIAHIFFNSGQQKVELTEFNLQAMLSYFQHFAARRKISESKSVPWIDVAKAAVGLEMRYALKDEEWTLPPALLPRVYVESRQFVMTSFSQLAMQTLKIMLLSLSHNGKYIFILEGGSGIGKSTMAEELLISMKMSYEVLTVGQPEAMRERLKIALKEGKKVIVNEINTPQVVPVITKFLIDMQASCSKTEGFAIIGTQNPVSFRSRELFPDAIAQHFAWIKLENFTFDQLCYIVRLTNRCNEEQARDLVGQFFKDQARLTDMLTPRDLFRAAEKYLEKTEKKPVAMDIERLNAKRKASQEPEEEPAAKRHHLPAMLKSGFFAAQSEGLGLGGTSGHSFENKVHFEKKSS